MCYENDLAGNRFTRCATDFNGLFFEEKLSQLDLCSVALLSFHFFTDPPAPLPPGAAHRLINFHRRTHTRRQRLKR